MQPRNKALAVCASGLLPGEITSPVYDKSHVDANGKKKYNQILLIFAYLAQDKCIELKNPPALIKCILMSIFRANSNAFRMPLIKRQHNKKNYNYSIH